MNAFNTKEDTAIEYLESTEKAISYIEDHLEDNLTVADVAGSVAYSYYHFQRMFEAVVGESIGGYIRTRRLSKAAEALLYTNRLIIDIALSLRFESHEAFSRAFKRLYRVSPSKYRKNGVDTIIGRKKPLDMPTLNHRQSLSLEPEIVTLPEMLLVGMRFPVSIEKNNTGRKWPDFNTRIAEIPDIVQPVDRYCFYEAHENCTYDTLDAQVMTTAFIGAEVSSAVRLPSDMVAKHFIGGKYAHFIHVGTTDSLMDIYQYIWGTWIPYNKVEIAARDDIERFTERFRGVDNEQSEIDVFLPVL